ncbi:DUF3149 domain-containing protein [Neisseriaceae bacterium TC5R-5]|nr:DUF3149 domain-containing protein [Neisseriaceae bacterium TC5R-5]
MELITQLLSDEVGVLSLITILVTASVVSGALIIVFKNVKKSPQG